MSHIYCFTWDWNRWRYLIKERQITVITTILHLYTLTYPHNPLVFSKCFYQHSTCVKTPPWQKYSGSWQNYSLTLVFTALPKSKWCSQRSYSSLWNRWEYCKVKFGWYNSTQHIIVFKSSSLVWSCTVMLRYGAHLAILSTFNLCLHLPVWDARFVCKLLLQNVTTLLNELIKLNSVSLIRSSTILWSYKMNEMTFLCRLKIKNTGVCTLLFLTLSFMN